MSLYKYPVHSQNASIHCGMVYTAIFQHFSVGNFQNVSMEQLALKSVTANVPLTITYCHKYGVTIDGVCIGN
jgi:hypothetical protein